MNTIESIGKAYSGWLQFIASIELLFTVVASFMLYQDAKIPGHPTQYGYVPDSTNGLLVGISLAVLIQGLILFLLLLAFAYLTRTVGTIHATVTAEVKKTEEKK